MLSYASDFERVQCTLLEKGLQVRRVNHTTTPPFGARK